MNAQLLAGLDARNSLLLDALIFLQHNHFVEIVEEVVHTLLSNRRLTTHHVVLNLRHGPQMVQFEAGEFALATLIIEVEHYLLAALMKQWTPRRKS